MNKDSVAHIHESLNRCIRRLLMKLFFKIDVNSSGISEALPAYASNLAIRITPYCFRLRHFALWHDSRLDLLLRWPTALIVCRNCLLPSTA